MSNLVIFAAVLYNVSPDFSNNDTAYCAVRDSENLGDGPHRLTSGVSCSNVSNIRLGQFVPRCFLSSRAAILRVLIPHIVRLTSDNEVIWVNARRIIAAMKDMESFGYGVSSELISKPVSFECSPFFSADQTISIRVYSADPKNASVLIAWSNILLESNFQRFNFSRVVAVLRAEPATTLFDPAWIAVERFSTEFARSCLTASATIRGHLETPVFGLQGAAWLQHDRSDILPFNRNHIYQEI